MKLYEKIAISCYAFRLDIERNPFRNVVFEKPIRPDWQDPYPGKRKKK